MSESGNGRASKVVTDVYKSIYALKCYCCGIVCLYIRVGERELRGCLGLAESWSLRWRIMLRQEATERPRSLGPRTRATVRPREGR